MHTSAPGDVLVSKRALARAIGAPRMLLTPTRKCRSAVSRISCRPQLSPQHRSRLHCLNPANEEAAAAQTHPASQSCAPSDPPTSAPSRAAAGAADAPSSSATPLPAVLPAATRVLKRVHVTPGSGSVLDEAGMHKPVGLVLFSAYVLGTASSLAGGIHGEQLACLPHSMAKNAARHSTAQAVVSAYGMLAAAPEGQRACSRAQSIVSAVSMMIPALCSCAVAV